MSLSSNTKKPQASGFAGKVMFAISILAAIACMLFMHLAKRASSQASSGTLLSPEQAGRFEGASFLGMIFDYFGNVAYLFPLVIVFLGYKLFIKRVWFKELDFFALGMAVLGFNFLVIGLCAAFSSAFALKYGGAGGILGDFLVQVVLSPLPKLFSSLIIVCVVFVGLFLFTAKTPWWYCDAVGAFICSYVPFINDAKETKTSAVKDQVGAEEDASLNKGTNDSAFVRVTENKDQGKTFAHGSEPVFGNGFTAKADASFGKAKNQDNVPGNPSSFNIGSFRADMDLPDSVFKPAAERKTVKPALQKRIEPEFSDPVFSNTIIKEPILKSATKPAAVQDVQAREEAPKYVGPSSLGRKLAMPAISSEDTATYGSSAVVNGRDRNALNAQGVAGSTIITDSRQKSDAPQLNPGVSTIIIKSPVSAENNQNHDVNVIRDNSLDAPASQSGAAVDKVTDAGKVSTVITRTVSVPPMPFDSVSGNSYESSAPRVDNVNAGETESRQEEPADFYESNANIISFDEIKKHDEQPGIEIEKLSSAFIPQGDCEDNGKLNPPQKPILSENGADFSLLAGVPRGIVTNANVKNSEETKVFVHDSLAGGEQISKEAADHEKNAMFDSQETDSPQKEQSAALNVPESLLNEPEQRPLTSFPTKDFQTSVITSPHRYFDSWRPSVSLLARSQGQVHLDEHDIDEMIERINRFMQDFKIKAQVEQFISGPVITRYDLRLASGVKSSAIRGLILDLCRNLMVKNVRVIDVIPGTPYVGLEVPNPKRQMITLGDVVCRSEFLNTKAKLPMCLGVNAVGKPVIADLSQAPHLLIAGTTGSGKSAGLNSILVSMLLARAPSELRLILVDPKQVEFSLYSELPHLLTPIITETDATTAALGWLVSEMERRYKLIASMRVHNIIECNDIIKEAAAAGQNVYDPAWSADMGGTPPILKPVPYIVLVIDEFADLMATSNYGKKSEKSPESLIGRITAKARAAGIHLILATQTPRSDVVTGVIKANLPSRIAYTVQSGTDSRVILDEGGAENLLGNGDMLVKYQKLENSSTFRAHGPFASNDDVKAVVNAWKERGGEPEYVDGITDLEDEEEDVTDDNESQGKGLDAKFDEAVAYTNKFFEKHHRYPPISDYQSVLGIGYPRAKKLKMQLDQQGIINE